MSTPTMKQILADTQSLIQEKRAEYKSSVEGDEKQAKGLDIAGAGDDSPKTRGQALEADQSALDPQKKPLITDDADAEPPSDGSGTPSQAKNPGGGDDSPMTREHALEADESALEPIKKPLLSDDIDAKEAADQPTAKLANDILTDIRAFQSQQKAATTDTDQVADAPEKAADVPESVDLDISAVLTEAGVEVTPEVADKIAAALKPAEAGKADEAVDATEAKQADGLNLELTTDVLAKIAAHILSTTEGAEYVEGVLAKEAGAAECNEILSFLADQSDAAEKQSAFEAGSADAAALHEQAIYQQGVTDGAQAPVAEKQSAFEAGAADAAALHAQVVTKGEKADDTGKQAEAEQQFYAKLGQAVADASISGLMGEAPGADMGGGAVPPEVLEGGGDLPPEMGGEELGGEELGGEELGGEGEVSPEELIAALEELVAEGTISEEEAAQVLEYIGSGGEGGEELGGEELGGGEEVPLQAEEAAPPASGGESDEGMEAEAAAKPDLSKKANELLAAIQQVREQKSE